MMKSTTFKSVYTLDVPTELSKRNLIRKRVAVWISENPVIPPFSQDDLHDLAGKIIHLEGLEERYRSFVMVCCGNEIWRPVVGSIP